MLTKTEQSPYAKVQSLPWDAVKWTGGLWAEVEETCRNNTVPHIRKMFENNEISHVVENFRIAAEKADGKFAGTPFGDGDFYKWMEAAIYVACKNNDKALLEALDGYIELIGEAQREDGYISTKQIIGERNGENVTRLGDINDFEVYNFGHLFTAACLHKRLTGKDRFMDIAIRAANFLEKLYDEAARTGVVKTAVCPSHYMGLVEIYRTTGEKRFLELAKLSISLRDSVKNGTDDNQDRLPLKQHEKIVGHAVRSTYLYAGVADLYAETGDEEYLSMLHKVWNNLTEQKIYLTGGCGALYNGVSPYGNFWIDQKIHQAFGHEYQLPNITAYNETCASIGSVLWACRMFNINPEARYFDHIEKTMLNVNLAAISFDGRKFFYENMLRRAKKLPFELCWPLERTEYIQSFCCPPNLARILAQTTEYACMISKDSVWMGMYGENEISVRLENGADFVMVQKTGYPWDGRISFTFRDVRRNVPFSLNIRVPGWVESGYIVDPKGKKRELSAADASSYIALEVENLPDARIEVFFDMPVRYTVTHPLVESNINQVAVERGPIVYCIESPDTTLETLDELMLKMDAVYRPVHFKIGDREVIALEGEGCYMKKAEYNPEKLYQTLKFGGLEDVPIRLIPYFAWDNRGYGEMKIWMPVAIR